MEVKMAKSFNHNKHLKGFTLAEVLITLGIIGIVAAMTLPAVISGYKKSVVINKLRKNYSLFAQAVEMAELKHGFSDEWPTCTGASSFECTENFFKNYLSPELHVIKTCTQSNLSECWKTPQSLSGQTTYLNPNKVNSYSITAILNNGTSILMWAGGQAGTNPHWQIWLDLDGPNKGRGIIGSDVFRLMLWYKTTTSHKKGISISADGGDVKTDPIYGCSTNANHACAGLNCAALIQASGWTIPDDYPVHF